MALDQYLTVSCIHWRFVFASAANLFFLFGTHSYFLIVGCHRYRASRIHPPSNHSLIMAVTAGCISRSSQS